MSDDSVPTEMAAAVSGFDLKRKNAELASRYQSSDVVVVVF